MRAVAPSRGRGSKLRDPAPPRSYLQRRPPRSRWSPPRGGADRNGGLARRQAGGRCRPLAGARIETRRRRVFQRPLPSPPRGGADRNSPPTSRCAPTAKVAPSRGRGSKRQVLRLRHGRRRRVAPSRGRGSKLGLCRLRRRCNLCRPLAGARIETCVRLCDPALSASPPRGGADRNGNTVTRLPHCHVAPSRGRGSKLLFDQRWLRWGASPPRGGADRNLFQMLTVQDFPGSPPRGGADRNFAIAPTRAKPREVAPSRGRGSKHQRGPGGCAHIQSPPRGGADRNKTTCTRLTRRARSPPRGGADRNF